MIERLRLLNYKRFLDEEFRFGKRLTMFYGPNSCGKSSILRALQILRKSWESDTFMRLTPSGEHQSFGRFESLMSTEREDDFLGFEVDVASPAGSLKLDLNYYPVDNEDGKFKNYGVLHEFSITSPHIVDSVLKKTTFIAGIPNYYDGKRMPKDWFSIPIPQKIQDVGLNGSLGQKVNQYFIDNPKYKPVSFDVSNENTEINEAESIFKRIETLTIYAVDPFSYDNKVQFTIVSNDTRIVLADFEFHVGDYPDIDSIEYFYSFLTKKNMFDNDIDVIGEDDFDFIKPFLKSVCIALNVVREVGNELTNVIAIGPSRVDPAYAYKVQRSKDVGFHGEQFASILLEEEVEKRVNQSLARMNLPYQVKSESVDAFRFGLPMHEVLLYATQVDSLGRVQLNPQGEVILLPDVNPTGLPDLGYGLSQLLPILTQFHHQATEDFLPKGALTIEQPELHLHPSWQAELAHIFMMPPEEEPLLQRENVDKSSEEVVDYRQRVRKLLSGSTKGRLEETGQKQHRFPRSQVIVETHSEHFIQRLKNLMLYNYLSKESIGSDIQLYALQVAHETQTTRGKEIRIDQYGNFDELWPHGFFPRDLLPSYDEDSWED